MHNEYDNSSSPPAGPQGDPVADNGVPVLHEIVEPSENSDIPVLDASNAVSLPPLPPPNAGLSTERIAEIADTLQLTLNRELDYAIDGAVY